MTSPLGFKAEKFVTYIRSVGLFSQIIYMTNITTKPLNGKENCHAIELSVICLLGDQPQDNSSRKYEEMF